MPLQQGRFSMVLSLVYRLMWRSMVPHTLGLIGFTGLIVALVHGRFSL